MCNNLFDSPEWLTALAALVYVEGSREETCRDEIGGKYITPTGLSFDKAIKQVYKGTT
jgi:hypothetical protein